ncbi:sulfotransferase domain-containing protein [Methylobacterium dankookense]|uniref:sulfotransferase domain-containing protein n=1 Tax=Methylobacterium dankookense TaxID=560405 RepID=UPI0011A087F6|nr:sulfotransferase domain-containing protein [Methylobacterium dankookense]
MKHKIYEPPYLAITLGVYRSASTWAYNVSSRILSSKFDLLKLYADHTCELTAVAPSMGEAALVKMHKPDDALRLMIYLCNPKLIITVRNPLDCVASLMRQFYMSYEESRILIKDSASAVVAISKRSNPLLLRYEDTGGRSAKTVRIIADYLDVPASEEFLSQIAFDLSPNNVKRFIEDLNETKYFDERSPTEQVHAETQWHPRHVGDGTVGAFSALLTDAQIASIKDDTAEYCERFSYQ